MSLCAQGGACAVGRLRDTVRLRFVELAVRMRWQVIERANMNKQGAHTRKSADDEGARTRSTMLYTALE